MRLRLVVVAVFVSALAVPSLVAYSTGLLPGPTPAAAEVTRAADSASRVTALVWPRRAMGLAATDTEIIWEQRDPSSSVAGVWAYDVQTHRLRQLLEGFTLGKGTGHPSASGTTVVWSSWPGRRGAGSPRIAAYDTEADLRWTVTRHGRTPSIAGETISWVEHGGGATAADDAIHGVNALTDEESMVAVEGRVRDVAGLGTWVAWVSGRGAETAVWAGSHRSATRYQLAASGTAVTMDEKRVVWAARSGRRSTAIVSWNRRSSHSTLLCRLPGTARSLSLGDRYCVWTMKSGGDLGDVWAYDFERRRASPVSVREGRQVSPVVVGDTVFWADDRGGTWELYQRALRL